MLARRLWSVSVPLAASLICGAGIVVSAQSPKSDVPKPDVPKVIADALTQQYPHWVVATVGAPQGSCAAAAAAATPIIHADFNGDGVPDVAIQIQAGAATHVVMVLNRSHEPQIVDLDVPVGPLIVHKRGERYTVPGHLLNSYYLSDTLGTDICGEGDVWVWTGLMFEKTHVKP